MYTLTLVRHLPTLFNARGLFQGRIDNPIELSLITPSIERTALRLHSSLSRFDNIYSSPLLRCIQTAKFVSRHVHPTIDNRLTEYDFGTLQGLSKHSLSRSQLYSWCNDFSRFSYGEPFEHFSSRIASFLADTGKPGDHNLIFTHGVVIRYLIALSKSSDPNLINQLYLPNFSLTRLQFPT